eukprot:CAMPEP_0174716840 /NCGR_PEP_ID=MMETSP1094-20130205/24933_1 /TAXON_ID=156173 /ORGANISM="Chrysochromulina brevifilum, Strain UTEX LB 985" /LENGTH=58 /DNA_ID=CAMNT_0015916681 /DNA_START=813 /DNA_END=985 /DNA_ORIENTATION=-
MHQSCCAAPTEEEAAKGKRGMTVSGDASKTLGSDIFGSESNVETVCSLYAMHVENEAR